MNQVILMGRLVKDPEIRMTKGNEPMKVANYVLAVNDGLKKNGEQDVDFINCVAFGRSAELAEKYLKKGMKMQVITVGGVPLEVERLESMIAIVPKEVKNVE